MNGTIDSTHIIATATFILLAVHILFTWIRLDDLGNQIDKIKDILEEVIDDADD